MNTSFPPHILRHVSIQWDNDALTITPTQKPYKYCLIFLQGRNMFVGHFLNVFLTPPLLELFTDFKIVFPIPGKRPFEVKPGVIRDVYSWYDHTQPHTVTEAKEKIDQVVKKELVGLDNDPSRIFIGGFSQGCFLTLFVVNDMKEKIGGAMVTSGFYLKAPQVVMKEDLPPILVLHGLADKVVVWNTPEWGYGKLLENKNVKTVVLKDMNHDLAHQGAQEVIYSFLRGLTRGEPKPKL